jgi:hypothetical protein
VTDDRALALRIGMKVTTSVFSFGFVLGLVASVGACDLGNKNLGEEACEQDADCGAGTCLPSGSCSSPDDMCASGQRDAATGKCVDPTDPDGGDGEGGTGTVVPCTDMPPFDDPCHACECDASGNWSCDMANCAETDEGGSDDDTSGDAGSDDAGSDDASTGDPSCPVGAGAQPAADGCNYCNCDGTYCTDEACGDDGIPLLLCEGTEAADPFVVLEASIDGDVLYATVSYSGGCFEHDFGYCWDGQFNESLPVQVNTTISHEGHDDPCLSEPVETISLNLLPLRVAFNEYYGPTGTIAINLGGWPQSLAYTF